MSRVLIFAGSALAVLMAVLMAIGTTSLALFVTWGVLAVVGAAVALVGYRIESRQGRARMEEHFRGR